MGMEFEETLNDITKLKMEISELQINVKYIK
jgi:hypothetical protein